MWKRHLFPYGYFKKREGTPLAVLLHAWGAGGRFHASRSEVKKHLGCQNSTLLLCYKYFRHVFFLCGALIFFFFCHLFDMIYFQLLQGHFPLWCSHWHLDCVHVFNIQISCDFLFCLWLFLIQSYQNVMSATVPGKIGKTHWQKNIHLCSEKVIFLFLPNTNFILAPKGNIFLFALRARIFLLIIL